MITDKDRVKQAISQVDPEKMDRVRPLFDEMIKEPTIEQMRKWTNRGGCEATDGCWVEPDGTCEHGNQSWMLKLGLI